MGGKNKVKKKEKRKRDGKKKMRKSETANVLKIHCRYILVLIMLTLPVDVKYLKICPSV